MNQSKIDSIAFALEERWPYLGRKNLASIVRDVLNLSASRGDSALRFDSADTAPKAPQPASEDQRRRDRERARIDEAEANVKQQWRKK